jgi:hypothetical protein
MDREKKGNGILTLEQQFTQEAQKLPNRGGWGVLLVRNKNYLPAPAICAATSAAKFSSFFSMPSPLM